MWGECGDTGRGDLVVLAVREESWGSVWRDGWWCVHLVWLCGKLGLGSDWAGSRLRMRRWGVAGVIADELRCV